MKKLIIITDKTQSGIWTRLGQKLLKSRTYTVEDPGFLNSFFIIEKPELIYFNLNKNYEADDLNDLLSKINSFPLNAVILEASPVKIDIYSLMVPFNYLKKLFLSSKVRHSHLTFTGH